MIEILDHLPVGVVGFRAHGQITKDDYLNVIIPTVEGALVNAPHLRLLYEMGPDFTGFEIGAMWQDMMLLVEHPTVWKAVAVVSDKKWVRWIMRTFGLVMPCPVRVYACKRFEDAHAWITRAEHVGLGIELHEEIGVAILSPHGRLEPEDFEQARAQIDPFLEDNGKLHGIMIRADAFPGWTGIGAMFAHLRFVHDHHRKVARVAVVSDDSVLAHLPALAKIFVAAELKHFPLAEEERAMTWLKTANPSA